MSLSGCVVKAPPQQLFLHLEKLMNVNSVQDYGWTLGEPYSFGYISPRILQLLAKLGVKRILDVGSGNGRLCSAMDAAGHQVVGVEYDKNGVELATKAYPKIPFYNFGVQDDPALLLVHEDNFDAVVSTEVIEHLFSPHLLPEYAHRCLRDDGYLILTTPYHGYLKNLALSILDKWDFHHHPYLHGGHVKFWSRKTLSQLLSEHGFRVIGFSGIGRVPYLWKSMVLVAQKRDS